MKLLEYELSHWFPLFRTKYHCWCRTYTYKSCTIYLSLIQDHCDNGLFKTWKLDYGLSPFKLRNMLDLFNHNKKYNKNELKLAKQDVDNLILKINKLKSFL